MEGRRNLSYLVVMREVAAEWQLTAMPDWLPVVCSSFSESQLAGLLGPEMYSLWQPVPDWYSQY